MDVGELREQLAKFAKEAEVILLVRDDKHMNEYRFDFVGVEVGEETANLIGKMEWPTEEGDSDSQA